VQASTKSDVKLYHALIEQVEDGTWKVTGTLWNGKSGGNEKSEKVTEPCKNSEDGLLKVEELAKKYGAYENVTIIIDDY